MKYSLWFAGFLLASNYSLAQQIDDISNNNAPQNVQIPSNSSNYQFPNGGGALYSNGPIITSNGTGVGGEDESVLQTISLGHTTLGIGQQLTLNRRLADEFTIADSSWDITTIDFFAYQTGATASTITAVNLQIWDGVPGDAGSNIVFGDTTTNVMTSTQFSNILRVDEGSTGTINNRQIAVSTVAVNTTLTTGTYWLDWQSDGDAGFSGPWVPPITITGQAATGNSRIFDMGVWADLADGGTGDPYGLPFIINGSSGPPPPPPVSVPTLSTYALFLLISLVGGIALKRFKKSN